MAEQLEVTQLLANSYEPKRQFRWILEIDGVDAWTAKTSQRPKKDFEVTVVDYINQKRYLAGKGEWKEIEITLYDPIAPSASQKITQWLRRIHDDPTGRMGYAEMYKQNFSLKLLDGVGNVVEKWTIRGGWPMNTDFGALDYATSDNVVISTTIRYDEARQEF